MSRLRACFVGLALVIASYTIAVPAYAQQKFPDSTLYTMYSTAQPPTQIGWLTCGSLPQTEGCYGSGQLGPYAHACSIVQSTPAPFNLNTVLRYIYILDEGSSPNGATLTVYKRTDSVTQTDDTIHITTIATVALPGLVAGPGASCFLVQNPTNVYAATKQGTKILAINKTNYNVGTAGDGGVGVSALTADSYGDVTAVWSNGMADEVQVWGPNGQEEGGGGGSYFMINPIDGVNPADFPLFDRILPELGYSLKATK